MEFSEVATMEANKIRMEMISLMRTIRVLEWDKSKQQINPAKLSKLEQLKKRYDELASKVNLDKPIVPNETL